MTIWEIIANEEYNNAYLIDENGEQCFERSSYFKEIQNDSFIRDLKIETNEKGFGDKMNYWGTSGSGIVSPKMKGLLEKYFGDLAIQFFPCKSKQFPNAEMWILSVCEYHDVLDYEKTVFSKMKKSNGEEMIIGINDYVFTEKAFELDMFKIYVNTTKMYMRLYVSDRFKRIMEENGVTGLVYKEIYSV